MGTKMKTMQKILDEFQTTCEANGLQGVAAIGDFDSGCALSCATSNVVAAESLIPSLFKLFAKYHHKSVINIAVLAAVTAATEANEELKGSQLSKAFRKTAETALIALDEKGEIKDPDSKDEFDAMVAAFEAEFDAYSKVEEAPTDAALDKVAETIQRELELVINRFKGFYKET